MSLELYSSSFPSLLQHLALWVTDRKLRRHSRKSFFDSLEILLSFYILLCLLVHDFCTTSKSRLLLVQLIRGEELASEQRFAGLLLVRDCTFLVLDVDMVEVRLAEENVSRPNPTEIEEACLPLLHPS